MLELGGREEPHDLECSVTGRADTVRSKRGHDREGSGSDLDVLVTDGGDALSLENEQDLLGAVRVTTEVLARLDLEVDDGGRLRTESGVQREVEPGPHLRIRFVPHLHEIRVDG